MVIAYIKNYPQLFDATVMGVVDTRDQRQSCFVRFCEALVHLLLPFTFACKAVNILMDAEMAPTESADSLHMQVQDPLACNMLNVRHYDISKALLVLLMCLCDGLHAACSHA